MHGRTHGDNAFHHDMTSVDEAQHTALCAAKLHSPCRIPGPANLIGGTEFPQRRHRIWRQVERKAELSRIRGALEDPD